MTRLMTSPAKIHFTSESETSLARSRFSGSRISATMWWPAGDSLGWFKSAMAVFMVTRSAFAAWSPARMITERAPEGLTSSRSPMVIGSPLRTITRVFPVLPTLARIASSNSTLSPVARITMADFLRERLASVISLISENTREFQPRIRVWSVSKTRLLPLRSSSTLLSKAPDTIPIKPARKTRPPKVVTSIRVRYRFPSASKTVPGSSACIRTNQMISPTLSSGSG